MYFIYKFILWLDTYVEKPKMYGLYHIIFLILLLASCVTFVIISKKYRSERLFKNTLLVCWILLVIFELIKEIVVGFKMNGDVVSYSYNFYHFPYQLCSLPFYVLPCVIFIKNERIREYFIVPTMSFILVGGLALVLIPGGFKNSLYLNFHTMIHHCLQVFTSIVCIEWYKDKMSFKNYFKSIPLLTIGMILSIVMNIVIYKLTNTNVQLWNLSPYVIFDLEFLESIRQAIGYYLYVIVYYVLIIVVSLGIYMIPVLINNKTKKRS